MSKIYVSGIVGVGIFAVPSTDVALATATNGIVNKLSVEPAVAGLAYTTARAFVKDSVNSDGSEGERTLNCIIDGFTYNASPCPSEADTDTLLEAIVTALEFVPGGEVTGWINDVGIIRVDMWGTGLG
jgi:hypothetical protein